MKYFIKAQASYSPSTPIHASRTSTCENTACIYNRFIKSQMKINATLDKAIEDLVKLV